MNTVKKLFPLDLKQLDRTLQPLKNVFEEASVREGARKKAIEITGEDLGADYQDWKTWISARQKEYVYNILKELDLLNEEEFEREERKSFGFSKSDTRASVRHYLENSGTCSVYLPKVGFYKQGKRAAANELEDFVNSLTKATGGLLVPQAQILEFKQPELMLMMDEVLVRLSKNQEWELYKALQQWGAAHGGEKAFHLSKNNSAWFLTESQKKALQDYSILEFRLTSPEDWESPHPRVSEIADTLKVLIPDVSFPRKKLLNGVLDLNENPESDSLALGAQLLTLAKHGYKLVFDGERESTLENSEYLFSYLETIFNKLRPKEESEGIEVSKLKYEYDGESENTLISLIWEENPYQLRFTERELIPTLMDCLNQFNKILKEGGSPLRIVSLRTRSVESRANFEYLFFTIKAYHIEPLSKIAGLTEGYELETGVAIPEEDKEVLVQSEKRGPGASDLLDRAYIYKGELNTVPNAQDYIQVIEKLQNISDGKFAVDYFHCTESRAIRNLRIGVDQKRWNFQLKGDTNEVDIEGLLAGLNWALEELEIEERYFEYAEDDWETEFGVFFATRAKAKEFKKHKLLVPHGEFDKEG